MNKFFMLLCIVIIFAGIAGCPSSGEASGIHQSGFTSTTLTTDVTPGADSAHKGNGASPVPESATLLLIGSGLVGLAVFGRKKIKK